MYVSKPIFLLVSETNICISQNSYSLIEIRLIKRIARLVCVVGGLCLLNIWEINFQNEEFKLQWTKELHVGIRFF